MCFWQISQNDSLPPLQNQIFFIHSIHLYPPHNISPNWLEKMRNVKNIANTNFKIWSKFAFIKETHFYNNKGDLFDSWSTFLA